MTLRYLKSKQAFLNLHSIDPCTAEWKANMRTVPRPNSPITGTRTATWWREANWQRTAGGTTKHGGTRLNSTLANCLAPAEGKTDSDRVMDEITPPPSPLPSGWLEALTQSRVELAAGLTVPGDEVMRMLYESIARLETRQPLDGQVSWSETLKIE